MLEAKNQIIFYGPPGTGKTYHAQRFAKEIVKHNIRKKEGDEPTSSDKTEWFNYIKTKLQGIIPSGYEIDTSEGEEYFALRSKNDEKRIRIFYGNKEKSQDSVEVGFKQTPITWLSQVPEKNRFFIIINLSNASYVVLPYTFVKNTAQFRGGIHWDDSGENSMWFTMSTLTETNATLRANVSQMGFQYDCTHHLFNLDQIFVSDLEYVTFHPSYSYEEFMEGIRARITNNSQLEYYIEDGIFKRICNAARKNRNKDCKYVLLIDEINRGNISKIFGELITIIEKDKREKFPVVLTYSKERFTVPKNVYIVATMNTADRSLTQLDVALRRRFAFYEIMPDSALLNKEIEGISLGRLLDSLNRRIRTEGLREKQIGHSYFMNNEAPITSISELRLVFENEIIPLLQDYFYEDYEKIQKILGPRFVNEKEMKIRTEWKQNQDAFIDALKEIVTEK